MSADYKEWERQFEEGQNRDRQTEFDSDETGRGET